MNDAAYTGMLEVIDDTIELAEDAIKAAEFSQSQSPSHSKVTLVKVASSRAHSAAAELLKTGAFREYTVEGLAKVIESAGPADMLEMLEKLASSAIFPLSGDTSDSSGELVEKSDSPRNVDTPESRTELWTRCCKEAGIEIRG